MGGIIGRVLLGAGFLSAFFGLVYLVTESAAAEDLLLGAMGLIVVLGVSWLFGDILLEVYRLL